MFYKNKKVLVTGGTGFVGTHFVQALLERDASIRVPVHKRPLVVRSAAIETVHADLCSLEDCLRICEGIDCVIHAAGSVTGAGGAAHAIALIASNLVLTAQVVSAACSRGVDRLLVFSSSTGYPIADHPVREEEFWSGPLHASYFGYGWFRRYVERLGEFVHSASGTKVAIVRPTAVYGRYDNFDPSTSHVVPALIRRALAKEDPFVVWGSSDLVRDFLHVNDLVQGSLLLLEKHPCGEGVNIGAGKPTTVGELVDLVLNLSGHGHADVRYDVSKPMTAPVRMVDTTRAQQLLGYEPKISFEEGLGDTINWYRQTLSGPA